MKTFSLFLLLSLFVTTASCGEKRTVRVTVTEEDGIPIENARVSIGFVAHYAEDSIRIDGKSDVNGVYQASGVAILRMLVQVEKDGYYTIKSGHLNRKIDHDITLVLRKKINPIPLYAKKVSLPFPKNREWIGFDFQLGDWVAPHGKGKVADAQFKCDTYTDTSSLAYGTCNGTMLIKFLNNEGLAETVRIHEQSQMTMHYEAPKEGYENQYNKTEDSYHNKNFKSNIGYFFRVRVEKEGNKIITSNYGKISTDFYFDPRKNGWHVSDKGKPKSYGRVWFTYYFNPTPNDRNLEFDPSKNLFNQRGAEYNVQEP